MTRLRISLLRFPALSMLLVWNSTSATELPAETDLRPQMKAWDLGPRNQGERPTCSVFTYSGSGEDRAMPYSYAKFLMNDALWIGWES